MSFGLYFQFDVQPAIAMFDAVEGELKRWPADDLAELASLAMYRIKTRTKRGEDMFGQAFAPYSEEWEEVRREKGRQTDHVDLVFDGNMFAAMTPQVEGGAGVVGWTSRFEAMKAMGHHRGLGDLPERPWFGVAEGTDDMAILMNEAVLLLHRRIEGLGDFS